MTSLERVLSVSNDFLWTYILIFILIAVGIYFTIRTRFVQIRLVGEMFRLLGDGVNRNSQEKKGVSSFQAFCMSAASRVGTGNLAGVAIAIAVGGPGAVFWMWLLATVGAASSFVECTLAQIYKVHDKHGFRGGPAYYMEKALNQRWMGITFAVLITLCFGFVFNAVQANTITAAMQTAFGVDKVTMGIILCILTAIVVFGGVKRVAAISKWIVPIMATLYIGIALFVTLMNYQQIPAVFMSIVSHAFGLQEAFGGGIGMALSMGIKRGLFSNEAGMGSAPNAAATADITHPVKQGLLQTLGVYVDTLLVCSATAFIILTSGIYVDSGMGGIELTQAALSTQLGYWAVYFIAVIVFFFAYSSIVGNYYYGETNIDFIRSESRTWVLLYRLCVIGMVMFGSLAQNDIVWTLADLFMGMMALLNLIAIFLLGKYAFAALTDYVQQRKAGQDPVFYSDSIPGLVNTECWERDPNKVKEVS
ncbi:alanine/glycine:cation symporter family protein [Brevibacillus laterosporus]|uniref:alanine/glycine:cation symporter family protein n=1 Tax=Brevibacillus TaxID=55080 RepID=UPI001B0F00AB|nr:alanine/glycine:cation symporter family protein [Brevibacillus halotolerans]GIO01530.1 sodium:alanine symporter [Brevibacillus halotolerans]